MVGMVQMGEESTDALMRVFMIPEVHAVDVAPDVAFGDGSCQKLDDKHVRHGL
jgi:hypothetical protein